MTQDHQDNRGTYCTVNECLFTSMTEHPSYPISPSSHPLLPLSAPVSGSSSSGVSRPEQKPSSGVGSSAASAGTGSTHTRPSPPQSRPASGSPASRPVQPGSADTTNTRDKPQTPGRPGTPQSRPDATPSLTTQPRPQPPSTGSEGKWDWIRASDVSLLKTIKLRSGSALSRRSTLLCVPA